MASIKWRKQDLTKLSRYVQKFNTSITKLSAKNPELAEAGLYPKKLSVSELKESIHTRTDFNRALKSIDRWFRPKARDIITKQGFKMTRWKYQNIQADIAVLKAREREQRKKANKSLRQQKDITKAPSLEEKLKTMREKLDRPNDDTFNYNMEDALVSFDIFVNKIRARASSDYLERMNALYYNNYLKAINENFSPDLAEEYISIIKRYKLDGGMLYELVGAYPALDIDYFYSPEEEQEKFELLKELLPRAVSRVYPDLYKEIEGQ